MEGKLFPFCIFSNVFFKYFFSILLMNFIRNMNYYDWKYLNIVHLKHYCRPTLLFYSRNKILLFYLKWSLMFERIFTYFYSCCPAAEYYSTHMRNLKFSEFSTFHFQFPFFVLFTFSCEGIVCSRSVVVLHIFFPRNDAIFLCLTGLHIIISCSK